MDHLGGTQDDRLTNTAWLPVNDRTEWMQALRFVENYKKYATFIGVDAREGGNVLTYRYDYYTKTIFEDKEKRVPSQEPRLGA